MTPISKIGHLHFKREDLNPTGSVKDRSLPLQIQQLLKNNFHSAVISSTGNAAISASFYCHQADIPLTIFVSPKITSQKLKLLQGKVITSKKPISDAIKFAKANNAYLLRQSTDPIALTGYQQIAIDIVNQFPQITSLFLPVGSGTTLLGISQRLPSHVKIFAVQPASNPTLAKYFDSSLVPEKESFTDALSVKYLPLKPQLLKVIRESGGQALAVSQKFHQKYLHSLDKIQASPEATLTLAGYYQLAPLKKLVGNHPLILITGTKR